MQELGKTLDWINKQPASRHIDKKRIILAGFSAGGQVVAAYNGIATNPELRTKYQLDQYQDDFAAVILGYPVIDITIKDSFPGDEQIVHQISEDKTVWQTKNLVNPNSKPAFVWQTRTDDLVFVTNSLRYVNELEENGIPAEYHMFGSGIHGLALGTYVTQ